MKNIYLLDNGEELKETLNKSFKKDKEIRIKTQSINNFQKILKYIPELLLINEDSLEKGQELLDICKQIRENVDNTRTPIIVISSNTDDSHIIDVLKNDVELYLKSPLDNQIIYYSIKNILRLLNSNRMVSPLTGLPGNVQIQAEIKKRLINQHRFAMLYVDLDNFKAYNDTYGFSNGDEIIKFTARVITKNVMQENCEDNFVGHIGGDDFIAIVEGGDFEKTCQNIIAEFDKQVGKYFTPEDYKRGYIEVENRKGIMEEFPLTSMSIGAVEVTADRFKNTLEIGEAGAAVKHLAKTIFGSTYVLDRRKK
ncbi:MAG: diguanylate cyclase [Clostridia bacterium]|nr:diguanylate cyclase [Clostridia bacterium]